jgi:hypothetical protein
LQFGRIRNTPLQDVLGGILQNLYSVRQVLYGIFIALEVLKATKGAEEQYGFIGQRQNDMRSTSKSGDEQNRTT